MHQSHIVQLTLGGHVACGEYAHGGVSSRCVSDRTLQAVCALSGSSTGMAMAAVNSCGGAII